MFRKSRMNSEAARRRYDESRAGSGDFIYQGVELHFTLLFAGDYTCNKVEAFISYDNDDVPWMKRSEFESGALRFLKQELDEYTIIKYQFINK